MAAATSGARPHPARLAGWAGGAGAVFLGAVLLVATAAKVVDPAGFARQIAAEGLDVALPAATLAVVALAVEAFLAVALLLAVRRPAVLVPAGLLIAFFLALTGRAWWRSAHGTLPADAGCGCFGNLVQRTPAEAFVQDLLLLVPAFALAVFAGRSAGPLPRGRLAAATVVALATAGLAIAAPGLPLDDLATRLSPGVRVGELCVGREGDAARECLDSAGLLPETRSGEALVVLAALDQAFAAEVESLNGYHAAAAGPPLFVVTDADNAALFQFRFGHGPAFPIRQAPTALLRPLYRTLPRSFHVRDGVVVATWSGLAPLTDPSP